MTQSSILLIDCNPGESTGEALEEMLASSRLGDKVCREVLVDPDHNKLAGDWFENRSDSARSLIFLILPRAQSAQGGVLLKAIKREQLKVPIIVVIEDCGPVETLELLQQGASDF